MVKEETFCNGCCWFDPKDQSCRHKDNLKVYFNMFNPIKIATCNNRKIWKEWNASGNCERREEGEYVQQYERSAKKHGLKLLHMKDWD